ncbi:DUF2167 domain-containing protein [Devosia limi]|nr:DUF2167 domain-containing protein [Devosia limi]
MRVVYTAVLVVSCILLTAGTTHAQRLTDVPPVESVSDLPWVTYPSMGVISDQAEVSLQGGLYFLGEEATSRFLVLNGNPARRGQFTLAPESLAWFAIFNFDASGYVRDDEKIDADALLSTLKEQNASGFEERKRLGLTQLTLVDWSVPPHYDATTKRLEWGTLLMASDGTEVANYTVRILGRSGVMRAVLVSDTPALKTNVAAFHASLAGFGFLPAHQYGAYQQGDRIAEYGLAALIVGGAAAVATKSGFLKTFGVFLFAIGAAVVAAIGALFRRVFRRSST